MERFDFLGFIAIWNNILSLTVKTEKKPL